MTDKEFKQFIIGILRRSSYKWAPREQCRKEAKVERGKYRCAICGGIFQRKNTRVDHIDPVVDPTVGFTGWDEYICRMFPEKEGFQVICIGCHNEKTAVERKIRQAQKNGKLTYLGSWLDTKSIIKYLMFVKDITKCKGDMCPKKHNCVRYLAPSETLQSYFLEIPYNKEKDTCDSYFLLELNVKRKKKKRNRIKPIIKKKEHKL